LKFGKKLSTRKKTDSRIETSRGVSEGKSELSKGGGGTDLGVRTEKKNPKRRSESCSYSVYRGDRAVQGKVLGGEKKERSRRGTALLLHDEIKKQTWARKRLPVGKRKSDRVARGKGGGRFRILFHSEKTKTN